MNISVAVLAFTCVTNLLLGTLVLLRNPRNRVGQSFFGVSLNASLWAITNYLTEAQFSTIAPNRFFNRFAYFFSALAVVSILVFCINFYNSKRSRYLQYLIWSIFALVPVALSDLVSGTVAGAPGDLKFTPGPLLPLFLLLIFLYVLAGVRILWKVPRRAGEKRHQARFILAGFSLAVVGSMAMNGIIPLITHSYATAKLGPLATFFLVYAIGYSIIKHRLFDIRLIVARSLAYGLSIITLGTFYGLVAAFVLNRLIFNNSRIGFKEEIIFALMAVVLAFTLQPLRAFFDKITNKLFYRDAYDPQAFLDELNGVIVSNIELDPLLNNCVQIVEKHMRVEFCLFGIRETTYSERRLIGSDHRKFSEEDIQKVRAATPSIHQRIIVTDELEEGHEPLRRVLTKNDIAAIGRLSTDIVHTTEGIGYMVLGAKKSGNPFNRQDLRVLEIITKELVVAIQNALRFEEIQNFNLTLQKRVDSATTELRRSNEKLKELDETKDDFISMASHQLRTPLTSVKGYLSMVLEGDAGKLNKNQTKLLDQAFTSSQRMVYLISDLLNLSRLKTGKFVIETHPVSLSEIIEGEVGQLIDTAAARGLKLTFEKPDSFPALMLDETKIRQVIMNFVDNAIYYTPSGGNIKVALKELAQSVEFTVTDNGIGVPKHEQHHLFTKFYRAGNAKKARPDGTGLGLFMAKKVIIAQGGSVLFQSVEGKGSTFGFTFSKAKLKPPVITHAPEEAPQHASS